MSQEWNHNITPGTSASDHGSHGRRADRRLLADPRRRGRDSEDHRSGDSFRGKSRRNAVRRKPDSRYAFQPVRTVDSELAAVAEHRRPAQLQLPVADCQLGAVLRSDLSRGLQSEREMEILRPRAGQQADAERSLRTSRHQQQSWSDPVLCADLWVVTHRQRGHDHQPDAVQRISIRLHGERNPGQRAGRRQPVLPLRLQHQHSASVPGGQHLGSDPELQLRRRSVRSSYATAPR